MNMLGLLGVLFAAAKILGYIQWSWLVVLLPFILQGTLVVVLLTLGVAAALAKGRS